MTDKEKAQRYDEAIERAKAYQGLRSEMEIIFPELKESEGERVWIINYLSNRILNSTIIAEKENLKNAIAWLENQGEQKPITHKYNVGATIYYNSFGETKSMVVANVVDIGNGNPMYEDTDGNAVFEKDIIEQKLAWSEEDKYLLDETIKHLEALIRITKKQGSAYSDEIQYYQRDIDWLKFLRPQNTWKPSDEQMATFWDAICNLNNDGYKWINDMKSLFQDLKKLKG